MLSSKREHELNGNHAVTDEEACLNGIHAVTGEEACIEVEVEVACRSIWER